MCGRFTLTAEAARLQERFACDLTALAYTPSYNVAPGQEVLALMNTEEHRAAYLRWGLVPAWATDPRIGHRLINARAETVAEKPSFRPGRALGSLARCLWDPSDHLYHSHDGSQ